MEGLLLQTAEKEKGDINLNRLFRMLGQGE